MDRKDIIELFVDGESVFRATTTKGLLGATLTPFIPHLQWMSTGAIQEVVNNAIGMAEEVGDGAAKRYRKAFARMTLPPGASKGSLVEFTVNICLASEGSGLLPGFGMATTERGEEGRLRVISRSFLNPERSSLTTIK